MFKRLHAIEAHWAGLSAIPIRAGRQHAGLRVFSICAKRNWICSDCRECPRSSVKLKLEKRFHSLTIRIRLQFLKKHFRLQQERGEVIALVGLSGRGQDDSCESGAALLTKPTSGTVRIDGTDIKKVTLRSLREQIAVVTQENIFIPRYRVEQHFLWTGQCKKRTRDRCSASGAGPRFHSGTPSGLRYNRNRRTRHSRLSGGQRQTHRHRARAILKDSPILILDEATSELDTESEMFVQKGSVEFDGRKNDIRNLRTGWRPFAARTKSLCWKKDRFARWERTPSCWANARPPMPGCMILQFGRRRKWLPRSKTTLPPTALSNLQQGTRHEREECSADKKKKQTEIFSMTGLRTIQGQRSRLGFARQASKV